MFLINNLTSDAEQKLILTGIAGVQIQCELRFMPRITTWMMNIIYGAIEINGVAVLASPNLLKQWAKLLPFGIACLRDDGLDPYQIDDFSTGTSRLYLMNSTEVAEVEALL